MLHLHLRLTLLAFITFIIGLLLIRAQPYDERQRYQRFVPDGCSAACFIGIRPGKTTVDEALGLLGSSAWINEIDNRTVNNVSGFISWNWSDDSPDWIRTDMDGEIWATQKQIVSIIFYSDLQVGDSRLALGLPDQEVIDRLADRRREFALYSALYGEAGLLVQSWQPCRVLEPLRTSIMLTFMNQANPKSLPQRDSLNDLRHTCVKR